MGRGEGGLHYITMRSSGTGRVDRERPITGIDSALVRCHKGHPARKVRGFVIRQLLIHAALVAIAVTGAIATWAQH